MQDSARSKEDKSMANCEHLNTIIDLGESSYVCCDCGCVLEKHFEACLAPTVSTQNDEWSELAKDILDRHHISTNYSSFIMADFNLKEGKKTVEKLLFSIYKVLNRLDVNVSLHDISMSVGVSLSKIYLEQKPREYVALNMASLAEKHCIALNIDFQTTAVIKEQLNRPIESGHTPATIVAGTIYKVCKSKKLNISIKKISEATSVSGISIQRFKNAFP